MAMNDFLAKLNHFVRIKKLTKNKTFVLATAFNQISLQKTYKTMNKKLLLLIIVILSLSKISTAQYYVSNEFKSAIEKQTRTETGLPGAEYKTNFAEYVIDANFNTKDGMLEGTETITYHYNCGAKYLGSLRLQIYRDVYKKGAIRQRSVDSRDIFDGVELEVSQNGKALNVNRKGTIAIVSLKKVISVGEKTTITVKWRTPIAAYTHLRGGKYAENTWVVPYWYPQVAVYDDIYGWDEVSHSGNEEFYFEFANYQVNLTVGNNCNVWATGTLTNENEIYTPEILKRINKSKTSNEIVKIISTNDFGHTLRKQQNTWKFKADSVSDFVFAVSDRCQWQATSTVVDKKTGRRVVAESVFRTPDFTKTTMMTKKTIDFLSSERPEVPFPYPHETIFEGSGGMEFPMFVNEDYESSNKDHFFTTSHEVTHTYFPFYLGLNQACFGFLDEGLTMFAAQDLQDREYKATANRSTAELYTIKYTSGTLKDSPLITPSYNYNNLWSFTVASYYKPQLAYTTLESIVGRDTMSLIMKRFVEIWHNKHPHPYDFFNLCKTISGKNLDEFFGKWFFVTSRPDIALESLEKQDGKYAVTLKNKGSLPMSVSMEAVFKDDSKITIEKDAGIWLDNNENIYKFDIKTNRNDLNYVKILNLDNDMSNNIISYE